MITPWDISYQQAKIKTYIDQVEIARQAWVLENNAKMDYWQNEVEQIKDNIMSENLKTPLLTCKKCGELVNNHESKLNDDGFYYHNKCKPVEAPPPVTPPIISCIKCNKHLTPSERLIYTNKCEEHANNIDHDQHEPGAKLDTGKNRLGLVLGDFSRALWQVGLVGTAGANKYSPHGYISVPDGVNRYTDAMMRHYMTEESGEKFDPELSKMVGEDIHHAACITWNALARLDLMLRELESNG